MSNLSEDLQKYFSGDCLYGNDFDDDQISAWFRDEEDGYYNLTTNIANKYQYGYHEINKQLGYSRLPEKRFSKVLGIGSAYGHELFPLLGKCDSITIIEPSSGFSSTNLEDVPVTYIKPLPSGILPFDSNEFDLIVCFSVLHHVPNVSKVLMEVSRCLKPGGYVLLRDSIISMGDWRKPRTGLTKRERGIPVKLFDGFIDAAGFKVIAKNLCMFSLTSRLRFFLREPVYNCPPVVMLDRFICSLPIWPTKYHATSFLDKVRPTSVFYILSK